MEAMLIVSLILLGTSQSRAQLFPFSNLRQYFDYQARNGPGGSGVLHILNEDQSTARSDRQDNIHSESKLNLPPIPHLDPSDIFPEQSKIEEKVPSKRENNAKEVTTQQTRTRRRKPIRTTHESRTEYSTEQSEVEVKTDTILVTPKPVYRVSKPNHEYERITKRKSTTFKPTLIAASPTKESRRVATPVQYGSVQINTGEEPILVNLGAKRRDNIESTSKAVFPSHEPVLVESIPSLHFAVEQPKFRKHTGGLVDYLTPPKLPSIYAVDQTDNNDDITERLSKLKPPPPISVKKMKNRIKKFRQKPSYSSSVREVIVRKPKAESSQSAVVEEDDQQSKSTVDNVRVVENSNTEGKTKTVRQAGLQLDEQITAETGFTGVATATHGSGQRVEFQMHGQNGPESYKFGYDTGKGHNRQFRFEEKDNHGHVKGHYGYYDKTGKLQVVNYEAGEDGFKAEPA